MSQEIPWEDFDFKGKSTGNFYTKCPLCSEDRRPQNKKKKCFSINLSKGVGKCHNCEAITYEGNGEVEPDTTYVVPKQDWKNYTELSDDIVKWLESRKINQHTAMELGWTMEKKWHADSRSDIPMLCFNSFEKRTVVNKKYRTGRSKYFTQDEKGKNIFYNINSAIGQDEIYIVEGQMDVAAFYEVGIKNVISLPNGAKDNDATWTNSISYLEDVEKFYIAVDNDAPGKEVSEKIAHRIGKWKCEQIIFKNKDANDDLIEGKDVLLNSVKSAKKYPVTGTFTAEDLLSELHDIYEVGLPPVVKPKHRIFDDMNEIFSVMFGHLVVGTGIPSHGKSSFTEWYVMNLVKDHNLKAAFFSPEHIPMALHMSTFVEKAYGKNYHKHFEQFGTPRITLDEVDRYAEWSKDKIYYTSADPGKYATWDWVIEKFHEIRFTKGARIFVVDAFNKVEFDNKDSDLKNIRTVLSRLTDFAMRNDSIVFLVAHPTKMDKNDQGNYRMPTLYDVSGSSDFRNMTHDGFSIYRTFENPEVNQDGFTTFVNLKTKMNFQGKIGAKAEFDYHIPSGRYYPRGEDAPTFCLIDDYDDDKIEEAPDKLPTQSPEQAFEAPLSRVQIDNEITGVPF